jgi:hypothetical protein
MQHGHEHCVIDAEDYVDIPSHFNQVMSDFVWQMQAKSSANIKLLDEVIVMVRTLVNGIVEPVNRLLKQDSLGSSSVISNLVEQLKILPEVVDKYSSEYKRLKM